MKIYIVIYRELEDITVEGVYREEESALLCRDEIIKQLMPGIIEAGHSSVDIYEKVLC